jgi:SAM-dependent methyltransferase
MAPGGNLERLHDPTGYNLRKLTIPAGDLSRMRNLETWKPTKYIRKNGRLMASRDPHEVDVASRLIADRTAELYDAYLPIHAKGRLLDLGCGKVPLYDAYRKFVVEAICVDWGNTLHKNDHLDFEADLTQTLPFQDGEFDTILLSDVLEHIPDPDRFCLEIARVLAPGGKLLMNVPFFYWLHEKPYDYYRYTEFALKRFMERSGMRVLHLQATGGSAEIVADVFAKHVRRLPVVGTPSAIFCQWAVAAFTRTSIGQRVSIGTGKTFPLGYFMVAVKG